MLKPRLSFIVASGYIFTSSVGSGFILSDENAPVIHEFRLLECKPRDIMLCNNLISIHVQFNLNTCSCQPTLREITLPLLTPWETTAVADVIDGTVDRIPPSKYNHYQKDRITHSKCLKSMLTRNLLFAF